MKVKVRSGMMTITLPVIVPVKKSKSGKTLLVASSHGNRRTALKVDKKHVIVNANAYIRPVEHLKGDETPRRKGARANRPKKTKR